MNIKLAAKIIQSGGLVAFPTETVYGLGADASNDVACQKIFAAKGRPRINPLIVHLESLEQAMTIGEFSDESLLLAEHFWPGPLSIVVPLKKPSIIAKSVTAGLDTIALRIPANQVAQELIKRSGVPIAAPSANLSGYISATTHDHVRTDFEASDVFILESDTKCDYGIESTIIDMSTNIPTLLRYGFITPESIGSVLKSVMLNSIRHEVNQVLDDVVCSDVLKAPGMMDKHYSPTMPLRLNAETLLPGEIGLNFGDSNLIGEYSLNLSMTADLVEAASNLYVMLRALDEYGTKHSNITGIAVAEIPKISIGIAIGDRLNRAAKS